MFQRPRRRRPVSARTLLLLSPFFRYNDLRDAYVLRAVGDHFGPVLIKKVHDAACHPRPRKSMGAHDGRLRLPTEHFGLLERRRLVIFAGIAGAVAALGLVKLSSTADAPRPSGDRGGTASSASASPQLHLRILSAVLHPASLPSGRRRQRARLTVHILVHNRGGLAVTPATPRLRVGRASVQTNPNAPPGFRIDRIGPGRMADVRLRFEVRGAVTQRLRRRRRAEIAVGASRQAFRLVVGRRVSHPSRSSEQ